MVDIFPCMQSLLILVLLFPASNGMEGVLLWAYPLYINAKSLERV